MIKLIGLGLVSCLAMACASAGRAPVVAANALCAGGSVHGDAELEAYRHCAEVSGDLKIEDVCGVSTLAGLRKVSGTLSIAHNNGLDSLTGLEQLQEVSVLELRDNPRLDDVSQVSQLRRVHTVVIEGNAQLRDLRGLSGLAQIDRLTLLRNGFYSLHGLENLAEVAVLELNDNERLIDAGALNHLVSARSVMIERNPRLCSWFGVLRGLTHSEQVALSGNIALDKTTLSHFEKSLGQVSIAAR